MGKGEAAVAAVFRPHGGDVKARGSAEVHAAFGRRVGGHRNRVYQGPCCIEKCGEQAHGGSAIIEPVAVHKYRLAVDKTQFALRTLVARTDVEYAAARGAPRHRPVAQVQLLNHGAHLALAGRGHLGRHIHVVVVGGDYKGQITLVQVGKRRKLFAIHAPGKSAQRIDSLHLALKVES